VQSISGGHPVKNKNFNTCRAQTRQPHRTRSAHATYLYTYNNITHNISS
jgi:hypothetical protein